jgi:hypothetical protein
MKHFATALLGFGIMLAALPTARAADTTCATAIHNTTINGNLVVPVYCALEKVTVTGNVQVQTNAQLIIVDDSTIDGNLSIGTGAIFEAESGLTVDGNIEANQCVYLITNFFLGAAISPIIVGGNVHIESCGRVEFQSTLSPEKNEIGGNFTCSNSQICVVVGTHVNGNVQFTNNSTTNGSFSGISDSTIGGNLKCQGNGNITGGGGNTVGGHKQGQCANF